MKWVMHNYTFMIHPIPSFVIYYENMRVVKYFLKKEIIERLVADIRSYADTSPFHIVSCIKPF